MVCSPEISRVNGAKSRGPKTERGKAVVSRNALKHGLRATNPPILLSEDLETFQGMVQSLVDEYSPKTATEHLLIQQVAMGWQRLHRIWGTETAIANLEMIRAERETKYPRRKTAIALLREDEEQFDPRTLKRERVAIQYLLQSLDSLSYGIPTTRRRKGWNFENWQQRFLGALNEAIKDYPPAAMPPELTQQDWHETTYKTFWGTLHQQRTLIEASSYFHYGIETIRSNLQSFIEACEQRRKTLDEMLADMERLDKAEHQAAIALNTIPDKIELLNRYERHLWRQLTEALDRLNEINAR
jgi:hypothetical protein